ncbi:MAG: hypothetical protein HZB38_13215 [Planctomycetes bacterium]|nr:hypothetical protein [Planctomycetota bacterium]
MVWSNERLFTMVMSYGFLVLLCILALAGAGVVFIVLALLRGARTDRPRDCRICSHRNEGNARFCARCGKPLDGPPFGVT